MAIKGSLEEASIPDVLQLLSLGKKTGCLSVTDWSSLGYVYVDQGRITYATIVNRRDRLGDILIRSGRITQEQLDTAIQAQDRDRTKRIGQLLVEQGAITREELERHMRAQIEEAVYFFFTWRTGSFTFEVDVLPERQDFLVSIEPESLMLEGARRTDEWTLIEQKVPSFGIVFRLDRDRLTSHGETLTDDQQRIAPLLNGKRDVGEIVDKTGLGEFAVGKALYGLVSAGLAHPVARKESNRRLSASGVRVDDVPQVAVEEVAAPQHLDVPDLLRYMARDGAFADATHRRTAAFHIADCPTCSKRLKELHRRRTAEQSAVRARPPADTAPAGPPQRSGERRTGVDRRQSDPRIPSGKLRTQGQRKSAGGLTLERRTGLDRRDSDRRALAARRRPSAPTGSTQVAAQAATVPAVDRRAAYDRRSWEERRHEERRRGERRKATSVDRTDRYAVERRSGKDRRSGDRRLEFRRMADRAEAEPPRRRTVGAQGVRGASSAKAAQAATRTQHGASPPKRGTSPKRSAPPQAAGPSKPVKPVVMKEQSSTLDVPSGGAAAQEKTEGRPRVFLTVEERKSLAGLPVVEMPGVDAETGPGAPPSVVKTRPESGTQTPDPTPSPETPAPQVRSAAVKAVPVPDPAAGEREVPAAGGRVPPVAPTHEIPVREPRPSRRRTVAWGGLAAAALIVGWFGRPMVQSLFGGSGDGGGAAADVAALQIPGPGPAGPVAADSVAPDSSVVEVRTVQEPARTDTSVRPEPPRQEVRTSPAPVATPPSARPAVESPERQPERTTPEPAAPAVQAPVTQEQPAPVTAEPAPAARAVPTLAGTVRAQESGAPLPGVRIGVEGTDLTATTDAQGAYRIVGTPAGSLTIAADLAGYMPGTRAVTADSGSEARVDLTLSRPPEPRDPDTELTDDQWVVTDATEAASILGMPVAVVGGLWIETIAKPASGSRPRIRVTQLTHSGDRVILVVARAGAPARQPNPRVTALRIIPASAAYPTTTGTASFGNLLVTAKTELPADSLRIQLGRLTEAPGR